MELAEHRTAGPEAAPRPDVHNAWKALDAVLGASQRWLGAHRVAILLGGPDSMTCVAAVRVSVEMQAAIARGPDFARLRGLLARRKPIHIPDVHSDVHTLPASHQARREGYRALTLLPLVQNDVQVGALVLFYDQPGPGALDDLPAVEAFATLAVSAAGRMEELEVSARRAERLTVLNETGVALSGALELESLYDVVFQQTSRVLPVDCFYIALWNPDRRTLSYCLYDHRRLFAKDMELPLGRGPSSWVIRHRAPYRVSNATDRVHAAGRIYGEGEETRSALHVPMLLRDRIVGVMSVQSYRPDAYTEEDLQMLETLAGQTAVAVENARLYKALNEAALSDDLTGLPNRRAMTQRLHEELARADRNDEDLCVLLLDLDYFKRVNDTFGHAAGDTVLQEVAALLRNGIRASDVVGRWGGEEFLIILPNTDQQGGATAAENLRHALESGRYLDGRMSLQLTGSFGAVVLESARNVDVARVLEIADNALYQAKAEGRNRVILGS